MTFKAGHVSNPDLLYAIHQGKEMTEGGRTLLEARGIDRVVVVGVFFPPSKCLHECKLNELGCN